MKANKIPISIFTTKWGHYSIAKGVEESLSDKNKFKIYFDYIPVDKISELTYLPTYRLLPQAYKLQYKAAEQKQISKIVTSYLENKYKEKVEKFIKFQKPQVVINTYFAFNNTLEKLSKKYDFTFINIVADPRTFHKIAISSFGYNIVFDDKAAKTSIDYGVNRGKIIKSGWFTQKKYYGADDTQISRNKLELDNDRFTLLIVGGSAGNYSVLKSLPGLLFPKKKIQLIFVAGESKTLLKTAKLVSKLFTSDNLKITPVGYTTKLNEYIKASDVVLGKAGPNLLFETVASQKPFIAISHIHGQEDGNLEIIKEYKLGIVEEDPSKLMKLLRKIINNPNTLSEYKPPIRKMADYNENSGKILKNFILNKIKDFA